MSWRLWEEVPLNFDAMQAYMLRVLRAAPAAGEPGERRAGRELRACVDFVMAVCPSGEPPSPETARARAESYVLELNPEDEQAFQTALQFAYKLRDIELRMFEDVVDAAMGRPFRFPQ